MSFAITEYAEDDYDEVWALHLRTISENYGFVKNVSFHTDFQNIHNIYASFLVLKEDDKLAGMVALKKLSNTEGEIKRLQVNPAFQGKGYGKALMKAITEKAKALGFNKLYLDVSAPQQTARDLYLACGFKIIKTEKCIYGPDNEEFLSTFMEKTI
ncbi:MAG: GNAT family N-acetyltransferase [Alphaproteobacteria bacterium]|nr:GNAT family N-acetyltransferase [Alphaproteobacteria bacterium]